MSSHADYITASYAVTVFVFVAMFTLSLWRYRKLKKRLAEADPDYGLGRGD